MSTLSSVSITLLLAKSVTSESMIFSLLAGELGGVVIFFSFLGSPLFWSGVSGPVFFLTHTVLEGVFGLLICFNCLSSPSSDKGAWSGMY